MNRLHLRDCINIVCAITVASSLLYINHHAAVEARYTAAKNLGIQAVNDMYDFDSIRDLPSQLDNLKGYTSEEVFEKLTLANDSRAISAYYKFKADKTEVVILHATDKSVSYALKNENISLTRTFLFRFKESNGKIIDCQEYELTTGQDNFGGLQYD